MMPIRGLIEILFRIVSATWSISCKEKNLNIIYLILGTLNIRMRVMTIEFPLHANLNKIISEKHIQPLDTFHFSRLSVVE
jgi:hypothetical protein